MSCDETGLDRAQPEGVGHVRRSRTVTGWLTLAVIAALLIVYAHVVRLIANPHMDEAYARTFLTHEFAVYPTVDTWKPGNGLDYPIGTYVDFHRADMRRWLGRLGWQRVGTPTVTLHGLSAKIYLHLTGEADPALRRHKLMISLVCHLSPNHAGEIGVSVNGRAVGSADCGDGPVTIEADLPPGQLGVTMYDEIEVARDEGSIFERIATRLGFEAQAVELTAMAVDAE